MELMDEEGAYCSYISGAGSTLMAMVPGSDREFEHRIWPRLCEEGYGDWKLLMLEADNTGAICVESIPLH